MIYGHSCAGKSSVVDILMSRHENLFKVSTDKIKWLISKYEWKKDSKVVSELTTSLAKKALSKEYSLIVESLGIHFQKRNIKEFKSLSKRNKIKFVEVNIESPFHIAKERFNERLKETKLKKVKISNRSQKRFKEMYDMYETYKKDRKEKIPTFDTSKLSPRQIANQIEKLI